MLVPRLLQRQPNSRCRPLASRSLQGSCCPPHIHISRRIARHRHPPLAFPTMSMFVRIGLEPSLPTCTQSALVTFSVNGLARGPVVCHSPPSGFSSVLVYPPCLINLSMPS